MNLLEQTVRELKGEEIEDDLRATVNLRVDLRIDESYVPDMNQRLTLYRRVAAARREEEIDDVLEGAFDRYGPLPASVLNLADYGRIRIMADKLGVETIDREARVGGGVRGLPPKAARPKPTPNPPPPGPKRAPAPSWWTARAKESEVKPGF